MNSFLTLPVPIQEEEKTLTEIVIFTLLYGASKGFMKPLEPFEAPQRSENKNLSFHFFRVFIQRSVNSRRTFRMPK